MVIKGLSFFSFLESINYIHKIRLSFVLFLLFFFTGCSHSVPEVNPSCVFELGPSHQKKRSSWVAMTETICEITDGATCSSEVAKILVTQPAEIDMAKYKNIAFTEIGGNAGAGFSAAIMERLSKNKSINVINRTQLPALLQESQIVEEDLFDPSKRIRLGKLLPGTVLVAGKVDYHYKESVDSSYDNCASNQMRGVNLDCHQSKRSGQGEVSVLLHFVETETGMQIGVKRFSTSFGDSSSTKWEPPNQLKHQELQDAAIEHAAEELIHSLVPRQEERHVIFYKNRNFPKLERGIAEAKAGKLEIAKRIFAKAISEIESDPALENEVLAAAKFNLGVIKTYEGKHEEAEKLFSEVDDLALNKFPAVEMRTINACLKKVNCADPPCHELHSPSRKKPNKI